MSKLKDKVISLWIQIKDAYLYFFRHAIIVSAWIDDHSWSGVCHRNWGDELNYYLIKMITNRPVISLFNFRLARFLKLKNYLCIGSLLGIPDYVNEKTIVWGAGSFGEIKGVPPKQILSVRGKLTRDIVIRRGIECPERYGDPALLLPLCYQPTFAKRYSVGIIPHVVDLDHPLVEFIKNNFSEIQVIDLAHYKKWTDVIEQICSCNCILSSSLHGLIVSDAYGIPNCWIELTGKLIGGHFKYKDYSTSVMRDLTQPVIVNNMRDINYGIKMCEYWVKPKINIDDIISSCPFKIKIRSK